MLVLLTSSPWIRVTKKKKFSSKGSIDKNGGGGVYAIEEQKINHILLLSVIEAFYDSFLNLSLKYRNGFYNSRTYVIPLQYNHHVMMSYGP